MQVKPPFDPSSLPPGTRIADKYVLGESIGFGEKSVVYSAVHRFLQRPAAVKVLALTDPVTEKRFAREARLAGSLRHPNIVQVYEVGRLPDGRAYLVMEHLQGETVTQLIARTGPLPVSDAVYVVQAVLNGLGAAHDEEIVHRDIRPDNLVIVYNRDSAVVKILDFGISRQFGSADENATLTQPGTILGGDTAYLAPEQIAEDGVVDQRTDIYAVGILLHFLLTARLPYQSTGAQLLIDVMQKTPEPPSRLRTGIPKEMDRVFIKACSKTSADRFQSAEEMSEALRLAMLFADYVQR